MAACQIPLDRPRFQRLRRSFRPGPALAVSAAQRPRARLAVDAANQGPLARGNPVAGPAADCFFDPALLSLAPATRPATGRCPRPLRPLRDYAVGLRLALPAPAAFRPRPRRDLDPRR